MQIPLKRLSAATFLIGGTIGGWAVLARAFTEPSPAILDVARQAVSVDERTAGLARAQLRAAGPAGLDALFTAHDAEIRGMLAGGAGQGQVPASWERVRAAIDTVARQRDAHASHLFWYTDLSEARRAARAAHRPILSLRLLGNLDEELSCANSRYFRTALYANRAISNRLRGGWILHWESVRPAPHMTIDFGDGRRVERTVTGNSLHYVLDEDGNVLDVWPGLVSPAGFLGDLERAEQLVRRIATVATEERREFLTAFHRNRMEETERSWDELTRGHDVKTLSEQEWDRLALQHASDARLDANSVALMRLKTLGLYDPDSDAFGHVVQSFQRSLEGDQLRNTYLLRPAIDAWFVNGDVPALAQLTDKIYEEVFLTPRRDPWLGLVPAAVYSGIDGDGRLVIARPDGRRPGADGVPIPTDAEVLETGAAPTALEAGRLTMSKSGVELKVIKQVASR